MNYDFKSEKNSLTRSIAKDASFLGQKMEEYYEMYDEAYLFKNTEHELKIFSLNDAKSANEYLLSELSREDIEKSIPKDDISWRWYVIGDFGSKDESLILDSSSQKLYLFNWISYPKNQIEIAIDFDSLLFKMADLSEEESVHDL